MRARKGLAIIFARTSRSLTRGGAAVAAGQNDGTSDKSCKLISSIRTKMPSWPGKGVAGVVGSTGVKRKGVRLAACVPAASDLRWW